MYERELFFQHAFLIHSPPASLANEADFNRFLGPDAPLGKRRTQQQMHGHKELAGHVSATRISDAHQRTLCGSESPEC